MICYGTFIYLQTVHVGILSLLFLSHFAEKLISNQSQSIFQAAVNSDLPRNATGKHFIHKFSGSVHTLFWLITSITGSLWTTLNELSGSVYL